MERTPTLTIPEKPRRHHGYAFFLFILGTLFPPVAVAARFGIGTDFWINLLLTICGYIPGHGHNFYIQNIRNNKNHARTPKWAQKWGLVDTTEIRRKERKSQWANRYKDRLPHSTLEGQPLEEGQIGSSSLSISSDGDDHRNRNQNDGLWRPEDEQYYSANNNSNSSGRWHYPANFDDAVVSGGGSKKSKKKKEKKDRWARTEDAYNLSEQQQRKKAKKKKSRSSMAASSVASTTESTEFPEDPEGGLANATATDDAFDHQF
uniref:Uncharacterized protein n=1 Tax=Moniliophthora roreri TaxID=221103 RepID=A0A0W0F961_MONRR